jgi:hypothetical protein
MKLGLDWMGAPCLMGPGFSPKLTFDLMDDLSYLVMLSGTLGGSMLRLLDNLLCFHRYGWAVGSAGPTTFTPRFTSLPTIVLHKKFVEGRYGRTSWFGRTTKNFPTNLMKLSLLQTTPLKLFSPSSFWKIKINKTKGKRNNYNKGK